ncbi:MAG TPA: MFS transporter [Holophagaceae bacterium]|nr:MFS transporter [Holophagaceae bacterium]
MSPKKARFAIFATVFVDLLGFGIVIPILPLYAKQIAAHPSAWMAVVTRLLGLQDPGAFFAGLAFVSFSVMQFIAAPILGRLSDTVGRRPVLWICLMGTALGLLIMAFTNRYEWVLAARILDGITGGTLSVAMAAMADSSTPGERSKVMGLIGAAFGLGFVIGPALAGLLSGSHVGVALYESHGWHLPFFVAAGLSTLGALLVIAWLPETLTPELRAKARQEESRGHALVKALGRRGMPQLLLIALLAMSGFAMMEGTFSLMANVRFNFGQREVGYLFGVIGILIVLYQGGLVRVVSKRIPERAAVWAGLLFMACALPFLPTAHWKWPFLLLLVPLAWGSGMNGTATNALASMLTPPEDQGGLFGVISAMQGMGRILGPAIGTLVFAKWGYRAPYLVASATVAVGLLLAFTLPKPASRSASAEA